MTEAVAAQAAAPPASAEFAPVSPAYGRYALTLLTAIYTVNFLDRQIITTIGEAIRTDLQLTDAQMGALGGIFFAAVYTVLGVPIARIADRRHRPWVLTISLAIWSGFTALSAFARSYAFLAFARAGVGVGEAGCSPTAHSLLADYFPQARRATALAIYSMGISIGTLLGMAIGGLVAEHYGWRTAYLVAGLPGLVFAVLAILTLREPRSAERDALRGPAAAQEHVPLMLVFATLEQRPTFWLFGLGGALTAFVSYAFAQFLTPFFLRNHTPALVELAGAFGMAPEPGRPPLGFLSLALGLSAGVGGALGSWLGGLAADRLGARDMRDYTLFPLVIPVIALPLTWWAAATDDMALALLLLLAPNIAFAAWWGPVYGGVQNLAPRSMRALSSAIILFVINIIGLGGGPTVFGILTDALTDRRLAGTGLDVIACKTAAGAAQAACATASAEGIRTALYLFTGVIPLAMICFWLTRRVIARDLARAEVVAQRPMSRGRLAAYLAMGGALPGAALGHASARFFTEPPALAWLHGAGGGAALGLLTAILIAARSDGPRGAPA